MAKINLDTERNGLSVMPINACSGMRGQKQQIVRLNRDQINATVFDGGKKKKGFGSLVTFQGNKFLIDRLKQVLVQHHD